MNKLATGLSPFRKISSPKSISYTKFSSPKTSFSFTVPNFKRNYSSAVGDHKNKLNISVQSVEHATGLEKAELLSLLKGEKLFGEPILTGAFGTLEKPVLVPSIFTSRLVGCVGGEGEHEHALLWHEVKEGKPLICAECGQVFKLVKQKLPDGAEASDHHH